MVPAYPLQSATAHWASGIPSLPTTSSISTPVLCDFRHFRPFNLSTPGGTVPSSYSSSDSFICSTAEEPDTHSNLECDLDHIQRHLRYPDGCVPPGRHCTCPGLLEQTTRCDKCNMVEDLQPASLASEWEKRVSYDPRCHGYERRYHARTIEDSGHMPQAFRKCDSILGGERRHIFGCATFSNLPRQVHVQFSARITVPRGLAIQTASESR